MSLLKQRMAELVPGLRDEIKQIVTQHGSTVIDQVTIEQAYGGMRGVLAVVCDTSLVTPETGLIIRGRPILELTDKRPEEIFWLLLTGELPSEAELADITAELQSANRVPDYIWNVLDAFPENSHPMAMLSSVVLCMEKESNFARRYADMGKLEYWDAAYDDAIQILGALPAIAAAIYRKRFNKGERIVNPGNLDWAASYAAMLGLPQTEDCYAMMRLYLTLHSDHENGNASAFTSHVIGSALADPFYSTTGGWNALAGPLHGRANQECLAFVLELHQRFGGQPTEEQLREACWELLNSGQVIPGYGHGVLRATDPRYVALYNFGKANFPDDEVFRIARMLFDVAPAVLQEQGKAKNPWPNVDAISGTILYHYGLTEYDYNTVVFAVSRAMGMLAQLIISRAIGAPIMRPKSATTEWIKQQAGQGAAQG
jgi:citrate synthase